MIQRSISEVSNEEKVQIHFKFNELRQGYAFIGREHALDNCDIYTIVAEIDHLRANRAHNPEVKHVYRRVFINKHKNKALPAKKVRSPRPDNKKKAISRELDIVHDLSGYIDEVMERKVEPRRSQNDAMAMAFAAARG